ncbi:type II/IV secretion system protein, partial [bacterium]|nr:type II/IV secretion system protein [bacterium]
IKTSKIFFTKMVSRIKIMCEMDITKSLPQDARFSVKVDDGNIAFRVSTYPTVFGDRIVLRVLGQEKSLVSLDNLGFYADDLIKIRENLHQPYGLILVTGPTGSGKSTTNYSMLNELNDSLKTIITVEDPVEILIEGINQSQIDPSSTRDDKEKFTFKRALKHILRQDPDIILIGELRDEESLTTAIRAATTGHLVFSTLHSNSVASSIMYLLDIGLSPKIFRSVVNFIISQRLVRKLCPDCKERIKITSEIADFLEVKHTEVDDLVVYEQNPYGCEKCNYIGYLGRTNIYEFLTMSSEIEECIMSDKFSSALLHEVAKKELGMQTMLENGIQKVKDGLISVEELFLAVGHKY